MSLIFGPVPSRRLGRSLGVDLVPFKVCTYDCIYCQLGRTTNKTVQRKEWVDCSAALEELKSKLEMRPDYITLSGSGEPTLHARIGDLIDRIHSITQVPVAVLTNGSLLWQKEVREDLVGADLVIPSLDASCERLLRYVNRPHKSITFERLLESLIAFREQFHGQYWLEVFLLAGYTSTTDEIARLAETAERIRPDRIHLNTVVRPPAESFAEPLSAEQLARAAAFFHPQAEVIADYAHQTCEDAMTAASGDVLELLRRRPCSAEGITSALGIHRNETVKYLDELSRAGLIEEVVNQLGTHYRAVQAVPPKDEAQERR